ncbi:hypothetical protein BCT03_20245 [Vibrio splendidus]|nr:hypothetical protein BCT03_20245 [Vibrio splendidus]
MKVHIPMLALTSHGGNRVLIELANYLAEKGNDVVILTTTENYSPFEINEEVQVTKILHKIKNKYVRFFLFLVVSPYFMKDGVVIANHFLTVYPAKISALIFKVKLFFFVQGIESECFEDYPWILRRFLKAVNLVSFNMGAVVSANTFLSSKLDALNVTIAHQFCLGVKKKWIEKSTKPKCYDVAYFARNEKNKGLERFLEIVSANPDLSFLCLSQNVDLLHKLESISPNIDIINPTDDDELYANLDLCKVMLLTSYFEGFALPPLEAMARGLPLIYFDCGGPSAYATKYNSRLISSVNTFKCAFVEILNSYELFSITAFTTASKFELESSYDNLNEFLHNRL